MIEGEEGDQVGEDEIHTLQNQAVTQALLGHHIRLLHLRQNRSRDQDRDLGKSMLIQKKKF